MLFCASPILAAICPCPWTLSALYSHFLMNACSKIALNVVFFHCSMTVASPLQLGYFLPDGCRLYCSVGTSNTEWEKCHWLSKSSMGRWGRARRWQMRRIYISRGESEGIESWGNSLRKDMRVYKCIIHLLKDSKAAIYVAMYVRERNLF